MNIGNKEIIKCYVGEDEVERIYLGDTLIYGEAPEPTPQGGGYKIE